MGGRRKTGIRELEIRELERKKTGFCLLRAHHRRISAISSTSVLLQFQILFDGVEKSMNSSKDFP